jgi:hypothetical protein
LPLSVATKIIFDGLQAFALRELFVDSRHVESPPARQPRLRAEVARASHSITLCDHDNALRRVTTLSDFNTEAVTAIALAATPHAVA